MLKHVQILLFVVCYIVATIYMPRLVLLVQPYALWVLILYFFFCVTLFMCYAHKQKKWLLAVVVIHVVYGILAFIHLKRHGW